MGLRGPCEHIKHTFRSQVDGASWPMRAYKTCLSKPGWWGFVVHASISNMPFEARLMGLRGPCEHIKHTFRSQVDGASWSMRAFQTCLSKLGGWGFVVHASFSNMPFEARWMGLRGPCEHITHTFRSQVDGASWSMRAYQTYLSKPGWWGFVVHASFSNMSFEARWMGLRGPCELFKYAFRSQVDGASWSMRAYHTYLSKPGGWGFVVHASISNMPFEAYTGRGTAPV